MTKIKLLGSLDSQVSTLEKEMMVIWDTYYKLHEQLMAYHGIPIDMLKENEIKDLIEAIQDEYEKMYPVLDFIRGRQSFAANTLKGYDQWIKDLTASVKEKDGDKIHES